MKIFKGYVLARELTKKANKTDPWIGKITYGKKDYIGTIPVVLKTSMYEKYKNEVEQCQDLEFYYPYNEFSKQVGRTKDYLGVAEAQRKKRNKPPFESIKIGHYKLLRLSQEFIDLANKGLQPYLIEQYCTCLNDFKYVITMQDMEIGFY